MALNAVHNERLECPKLLLDSLIRTVEFILDVCVFKQSVYVLHSGLRYLHSRVKAILRHGAKIKHHLIYTQPSFAAFDTWLEESLTDHSLIKTLYLQRQEVKTFYYDWAFLQDESLFKALLNCLHALATRDLDAFIDIPSEKIFVGNNSIQNPVADMPLSGIPVTPSPSPSISFRGMGEQVSANSRRIGNHSKSHNEEKNIQETGEAQTKIQYYMTDTEDESVVNVPEFSYAYGSPATSPPNILQLPDAAVYPRVPINSALNVPTKEVLHSSEPKNESVGFESILKSESEDSFVKPAKKTKSFLESGGYIEPPALGNFPLPQKGQSLTSFLSSLSETMPELDRENAHFNVSEALISAFERLKVQQKFAQIQEEERLKKIEDMFGTTVRGSFKGKQFYSGKRFPRPPIVHTETEESEFEYWKQQPRRPPPHLKKRQRFKKLGSEGQSESIISTTEATSSSVSSEDEDIASSSFSAENVALNLLRNAKMKDSYLPPACELRWLVSEHEAPQNLLPLPKNWTTSASESESDYSGNGRGSSVGVIDKTMRLRGTETWAPPRPQIIFTIHSPPNLNALMETQKYRCAGCGMKIDAKYTSTLRYCNYLGRYFCTGCHTLKKARLPQMILHKWDFSPYMVSNFSATLLDSLQSDPVYNVLAINSTLNRKVKLNNFRNYRIQLGFLIDYLKNCKAAVDLYKELDKFPTYYTADVDLYSLEDLINLRFSTGLPLKTKDFILRAINHVLNCELCKNLGFVCELCKKGDILFPFQINRVSRCPKCASCFHLRCFHPGRSDCPKCLRVNIRRSTLTVSTAAIAV